jgi:3-hydroxyacyl-CoA dehydrogenase
MKTAVVVGDGNVASDLFELIDRSQIHARRVAVADVSSASEIENAALILEASGLPLGLKRPLLSSIFVRASRAAIVCSDESVIPRHELLDGVPGEFRVRFAICHFFVPAKHLPLVELVSGEELDPEIESQLTGLLQTVLERTVVKCPDTPGFIANRVGLYFAFRAAMLAMEYGVRPDHADALLAVRFGVPRIGAFGLFDLVGLEAMNAIAKNMRSRLSGSDPWQSCELSGEALAVIRKGAEDPDGRFYRRDGATGGKMVLDLARAQFVPRSGGSADPQAASKLVARLTGDLQACCVKVANSTKLSPAAVDSVMCAGFGWTEGPFALLKQSASLLSN